MTDDCGAFNDLKDAISFETRTVIDFLKASAIVAAAVTLALLIPDPDARTAEENAEAAVFPFGSAVSLRSALPPGPTLSGESAAFSIAEAPPSVAAPPTRTALTRHFHPRRRIEPAAETHITARPHKARGRRLLHKQETPFTIIARVADAFATEVERGLRQLPVRLSQLFSERRTRRR